MGIKEESKKANGTYGLFDRVLLLDNHGWMLHQILEIWQGEALRLDARVLDYVWVADLGQGCPFWSKNPSVRRSALRRPALDRDADGRSNPHRSMIFMQRMLNLAHAQTSGEADADLVGAMQAMQCLLDQSQDLRV